jgi:hypothetical protein
MILLADLVFARQAWLPCGMVRSVRSSSTARSYRIEERDANFSPLYRFATSSLRNRIALILLAGPDGTAWNNPSRKPTRY